MWMNYAPKNDAYIYSIRIVTTDSYMIVFFVSY